MSSNRFHSHSGNTRARRRLRVAALLTAALSLSTVGMAFADTTSPGKNSAFASSTGVPLNFFDSKLTATIEKGKRRTVLAIEASYTDGAYFPTPAAMRVLGLLVRVNGVTAQPNPSANYQYYEECGFYDTDTVACAVTGTFWFDIDAAELANPGAFVGQPLVVDLIAGDLAGGTLVGITPMDAALSVRVQRK